MKSRKLEKETLIIPDDKTKVRIIINTTDFNEICNNLNEIDASAVEIMCQNKQISFIGKVGESITTEQAKEAAKYCVINVLAQLQLACNINNITLEDIKQCVKLSIFINADTNFTQHSEVANGASDLIVKIFGEKGKHVRASVGCGSLPFGVAVEVEAIFQIN